MTPEQLKASILQYAVEGKLVKQDPNDEPASELLKRIENEKAELIREGKIKKSKKLPAISNDEEPFDIPDSWEWIRLGNICEPIRYGFTSSAKDNGISKLVRITDIQNNNVNWNNVPFCDVPKVKLKDLQLKTNDILIARTGGTVGKSFVVKNISEVAVFASYLIRIRLIDNELIDFVKYFLDSPYYWQMISLKQSGTGQPNVNATKLSEILIPIPPIEEQKRIVAKIEKLMPLVDEYAESYNRLQKIDNEFEDKLKQSVLQYAMEGKLVKQNPSDEPASELIKKIENEKAELVKEGKIKKSKKLPAITDDEKPFDIPDSWEWVRLKQITTYGNFNSIKGSSIPDNSWVVDMKDVRKNGGGFSEIVRRKSTDIYKSNKYSFNKNAVLYGKLRPYLRKVEIAQTSGFTTTEMLPINVVDLSTLVPQYLRYAMLSPYFVNLVNDSMYGMKMPRVGTTFLAKMVVPLPPLEEQKRIVEKVEELQSSISNLSK
ncbi:restriction endonuclease subunit S [Lactobacillus crispatus]|uniref:restriction endonuclease subunit S n=1 Tax=Lactobacillus crispatus TaxID=47770 RepID=UPI000B5D9F60|nr:restriction endonuclease subunit S [Lactobacillus crispatus]OXC14205.1 hypothetical protein AYP78_07230 [Lactobacillus crispatus]OXC16784.1 hypothetical protein AYP79_08630 [Lactobacillus crispatus]OXC20103.1 hypothetical protein AYP80_07790 [Lactobacillus crispatus]